MGDEKKKVKNNTNGGTRLDQKLKSYLVLELLRRKTDRFHPMCADVIADKIKDEYGISAERRSIYRDSLRG